MKAPSRRAASAAATRAELRQFSRFSLTRLQKTEPLMRAVNRKPGKLRRISGSDLQVSLSPLQMKHADKGTGIQLSK
jgi:hypothetical protein